MTFRARASPSLIYRPFLALSFLRLSHPLMRSQSLIASACNASSWALVTASFLNKRVCIHIAAGIVTNFSGVHGIHSIPSQVAAATVNQLVQPIASKAEPIQAHPLISAKGIRYDTRNFQLRNGLRYVHIFFTFNYLLWLLLPN